MASRLGGPKDWIVNNLTKLMAVAGIFVAASAVAAGKSPIHHYYLYPDEAADGPAMYEGAVGKLKYNAENGDIVFIGNKLQARQLFELRSGGQFSSPESEMAVGNGRGGLGNNVVIVANVCAMNGGVLGERWNLWLVTGNDEVRVLRSRVEDGPPPAPNCG